MSDIVLNGKGDGDGVRMSWSKAAAIVLFLIGLGVMVGDNKASNRRQDEAIAQLTSLVAAQNEKIDRLTTAVEVLKVAPPRTDSRGRILK